MGNLNFNANDVQGERFSREPLPAGIYKLAITNAEMKTTKAGGTMLAMEYEVQEGPHQRRKLFININIKNDTPKAVEMGRLELKELCFAVGKPAIQDSSELIGSAFMGKVKVDKPRDGYEAGNSVSKYMTLSDPAATGAPAAAPASSPSAAQPAAAANPPATPAPAQPAAGGAGPWSKPAA